MALLLTCPKCQLEGRLPDGDINGALACPRCGEKFSAPGASAPPMPPREDPDGLSVWVGSDSPLPPNVTPPPMRGLSPDLLPGVIPAIRPPVAITEENAYQHVDWIKHEVTRFNAHVARQLEVIRKSREDLASHEAQAAAALVTREMELNRGRAELAARGAALDQKEAELASEREGLARRAEALDRMEEAIQRRLEEVDELEEVLRGELEAREAEIERQRKTVEEALRELRSRAPVSSEPSNLLDSWHCG